MFDNSIGHTDGSRINGVEPLLLELHIRSSFGAHVKGVIVSKFTRNMLMARMTDNCPAC